MRELHIIQIALSQNSKIVTKDFCLAHNLHLSCFGTKLASRAVRAFPNRPAKIVCHRPPKIVCHKLHAGDDNRLYQCKQLACSELQNQHPVLKGTPLMADFKKSEVIGLLKEMNFSGAHSWPESRIIGKLENLEDLLEDDDDFGEYQEVCEKILEAVENEEEINLIADKPNKGGRPAKKKKAARKKAKPAPEPEPEEEEEEEPEDNEDEEEEPEEDEEEEEPEERPKPAKNRAKRRTGPPKRKSDKKLTKKDLMEKYGFDEEDVEGLTMKQIERLGEKMKAKLKSAGGSKKKQTSGVPGVRYSYDALYKTGEVIREYGLKTGMTEEVLEEISNRCEREGLQQSTIDYRKAWHAICGFIGILGPEDSWKEDELPEAESAVEVEEE